MRARLASRWEAASEARGLSYSPGTLARYRQEG
jgi:hypothetical protein